MHHGQIAVGTITSPGAPAGQAAPTVRFVHYPDCQQLMLWLPLPGRDYGALRIEARDGSAVWCSGPVTDWLQGSIQLLFDTVGLAAGRWRLVIGHPGGFEHRIEFDKLPAGVPLPAVPQPAPAANQQPDAPLVYRDGFRAVIPDDDLVLRERVIKEMVGRFTRHLEYEGNFRSGYVTYVEGDLRIRLLHEMGGGGVKSYVELPTAGQWEAQTGVPLARRDEIVGFIAAALQREQAPSWRYEITADAIVFR